jgi:hypothetical protein
VHTNALDEEFALPSKRSAPGGLTIRVLVID